RLLMEHGARVAAADPLPPRYARRPPPCRGSRGGAGGVSQASTSAQNLATPTPNPSPQGGGESRAATASAENPSSVQHPGVFGAAALAGIDHQRSLLQRDAGEAAGHDADAVAA